MMKVISALTIIYLLGVGVTLAGTDHSIANILTSAVFGAGLFGTPVVLAYILAKSFESFSFRLAMIIMDLAYSAFTPYAYHRVLVEEKVLSGEQDAQWQLTFLIIPAVGLVVVLLVGLVAAVIASRRRKNSRTPE